MVYLTRDLDEKLYYHLFTQGAQAIYDYGKEILGFQITNVKGYRGCVLHDKPDGTHQLIIKIDDDFDYLQEAEDN